MDRCWQPLTPEEWPRVAIVPVFTVSVPDQRIQDAGLTLMETMEPGLGPMLSAGARLPSGRVCALSRGLLSPSPMEWVLEFEKSELLVSDVNVVLDALRISAEELGWVSDCWAFPSYEVHRQDDNGNEFVVGTYRFEAIAKHVATRLDAGGHRQMYWTCLATLAANQPVHPSLRT